MRFRFIPLEERIVLDAAGAADLIDSYQLESIGIDHAGEHAQFDPHLLTLDAPPDMNADSGIHVLVISSQIKDPNVLSAAAKNSNLVVFYDANTTTLKQLSEQISSKLQGQEADSIGFVNEGSPGEFNLTKDIKVNSSTLDSSAELKAFWHDVSSMIKDNGRIDLLACNVAASPGGLTFVSDLDRLVDTVVKTIDVTASTDVTGNSADGNWVLEKGQINADTLYFDTNRLSSWTSSLGGELTLVKDIWQGNTSSNISNFVKGANNVVFFTAEDGIHGVELWKTDGTENGTVMVKDINPNGSSSPQNLTLANGRIYFTADNGINGRELWVSDGTLDGTLLRLDINPGTLSSNPAELTEFDGKLYFVATSAATNAELASLDLIGGAFHIYDLFPGAFTSNPYSLTVFQDKLYFRNFIQGYNIMATDGVTFNTVYTFSPSGNVDPIELANGGDYLYFFGGAADSLNPSTFDDPKLGVWRSDGTSNGTFQVAQWKYPGKGRVPNQSSFTPFGNLNGYFYFGMDDLSSDYQILFKSDGTFEGTSSEPFGIFKYIQPVGSNTANLVFIDDVGYIPIDGGTNHHEILKFSENEIGTLDNHAHNSITNLINVNGTLFFLDIVYLWKSDGINTAQVFATFEVTSLIQSGGELYIKGSNSFLNSELWKINLNPVGVSDSFTAIQNSQLNANVKTNDLSDSSQFIPSTYIPINITPGSSWHGISPPSVNADGSFSYTSLQNFVGTDTFTYQLSDGLLTSTPITVSIHVTTEASNPTFNPGNPNPLTIEDAGLQNIQWASFISAGQTPADAQETVSFVIDSVTNPSLFAVQPTINATGRLNYKPNQNANGDSTITLHLRDSSGLVSPSFLLNITVQPINDTPNIVNDSFVMQQDATSAHYSLTPANDNHLLSSGQVAPDENNTPLSYELVNGPSHALSFSFMLNGSFDYAPSTGYYGSDSFTYKVTDNLGDFSIATVQLTMLQKSTFVKDITPSGSSDFQAMVDVNGMLFFTVVDSLNETHLWKSDGTTSGTVLLHSFGIDNKVADLTNVNGTLFFSAKDSSGTQVWKSDGLPGTGHTQRAFPALNFSVPGDFTVLNNTLFFTATTSATGKEVWHTTINNTSVAVQSVVAGTVGSSPHDLTIHDGALYFIARSGGVDKIWKTNGTTLTAIDSSFGNTTTLPQNLTSVENTLFFTAMDSSGDVELWQWDGTIASIAANINPNGSSNPTNLTQVGGNLFLIADTGTAVRHLRFSPTQSLITNVNSTHILSLMELTPIQMTVAGGKLFYVGNSDGTSDQLWVSGISTQEARLTSGNSNVANLTEINGLLFFTANDGIHGNELWRTDGTVAGTFLVIDTNPSGDGTFGPLIDSGSKLYYLADDSTNGFELHSLEMPTAANDGYTFEQNVINQIPVSQGVRQNDTLSNLAFITNKILPDSTTIINGFPTHAAFFEFHNDGSFIYQPQYGFSGIDTFTYRSKNDFYNSNTATVTITVLSSNTAPVADNDTFSINEDTPLTVSAEDGVLNGDTDADGNSLTAVIASGPGHALSFLLNADGSFTYTPETNFFGDDSFTYYAYDGLGTSNVATVTITIQSLDDDPIANDDTATVSEDSTSGIEIDVLGNDEHGDGDTLTIDSVTQGTHGLVVIVNNQILYTPTTPNFHGDDSFSYTVIDTNGDTDTATVQMTITPVDDNPVANHDDRNVDEDSSVDIDVLANDLSIDGDALSIVGFTQGTNGAVSLVAGMLHYIPNANFSGTDSFSYTIEDTTGNQSTATVDVIVASLNDPPVANTDSYSVNEDGSLSGNVITNDTDIDSANLQVALATVIQPTNGQLHINADGTFTYTPNANYNGPDSFSYKATDGSSLSNLATVTIDVIAINDPPVANNNSYSVNEDGTLSGNVITNDTDSDSVNLQVSLATVVQPTHGLLQINTDGTFTYTPNANYHGPDSFSYKATDGNSLSNSATVTINVIAANAAPTDINLSNAAINENVPVGSLIGNLSAVDVDNINHNFVLTSGVGDNAQFKIIGNQLFTNTALNFEVKNSYSVNVTATDLGNLSISKNFTIQIRDTVETPTAINDSYSVSHSIGHKASLTIGAAQGVLANDINPDSSHGLVATLLKGTSKGTLRLNADGSFSYVNKNPLFSGTDTFTYKTSNGITSNVATVTIHINLNPIFRIIPHAHKVSNNDYVLGGVAIIRDLDTSRFNNGVLTVNVNHAHSGDRLSVNHAKSLTTIGQNVYLKGVHIGHYEGGDNSPLKVIFNNNATTSVVQKVAGNIRFTTSSSDLSKRTIMYNLADGEGGISNTILYKLNLKKR